MGGEFVKQREGEGGYARWISVSAARNNACVICSHTEFAAFNLAVLRSQKSFASFWKNQESLPDWLKERANNVLISEIMASASRCRVSEAPELQTLAG